MRVAPLVLFLLTCASLLLAPMGEASVDVQLSTVFTDHAVL